MVDISVKVTSFRVRIPMPSSEGLNGRLMLLDQEVGFLAAGDVATTLPTRESLRAAMSSLWVNPSLVAELSMLQIAHVSGEILLRLWRQRSEMDVDRVFATVCLVGWCPRLKRGRAFLLSPKIVGAETEIDIREVQASEGPQYFGSGASAARQVSIERPDLAPAQVIRQVVHRALDPAVGGRVQYGKLAETDFRVYAVYDFDLHPDDKTLTAGFFIGGVELLAEEEKLNLPEGYMLLPNHAVTPFLREQEDSIQQGFSPVTNYAHFRPIVGRLPTKP
jgi:hypothetical protein